MEMVRHQTFTKIYLLRFLAVSRGGEQHCSRIVIGYFDVSHEPAIDDRCPRP